MKSATRLLAVLAILAGTAPAAWSQPPLLPTTLPAAAAPALRDLEALVWSDPWTARIRLRALPSSEGVSEASRQVLLAQALLYLYLDDEFAAAVETGLAALGSADVPLLRHHLAILDGVRVSRAGDFVRAATLQARAVDAARAAGLPSTALYATAELAYVHAHAGAYEEALLVLQDAAQEALLAEDRFLRALADETYAVIYTYLDEYDRAVTYSRQALDGYRALGFKAYEAEAIYGLATAYRYAGQLSAAVDTFQEYRNVMESRGGEAGRYSALYGLGTTYAELGACGEALPLIEEALTITGPPDYDAELLKRAAICHARGGAAETARAALQRSRTIIEAVPELAGTRWFIDLDRIDAEVEAALGNYRPAYFALQRYHEAQSALLRKNASEQRQSRRTDLENARQAIQIELLEEQARVRRLEATQRMRERHNERLGFIFLVLGLALVAAVVLWRLRDLRKFRELSNRDDLTGVANRRFIFERLQSLLGGLAPDRGGVALVLIDVDDFKAINDRHGHPQGDRVLKAVAGTLISILRPGDEIARVGGEEFLLVLPRTDLDGATKVANRARESLAAQRIAVDDNAIVSTTASIGVASTTPQRATVDALYAAADEALYRSKAEGKNRVTLASPG